MFGLSKYLVMGSVVALVATNLWTGYKAYGFGYDRATVIGDWKIALLKKDVADANEKIKKRLELQQIFYDQIEKENETLAANADKQEQIIFGERLKYQNEIRTRANLCLTSDDDARRLQ